MCVLMGISGVVVAGIRKARPPAASKTHEQGLSIRFCPCPPENIFGLALGAGSYSKLGKLHPRFQEKRKKVNTTTHFTKPEEERKHFTIHRVRAPEATATSHRSASTRTILQPPTRRLKAPAHPRNNPAPRTMKPQVTRPIFTKPWCWKARCPTGLTAGASVPCGCLPNSAHWLSRLTPSA